MSDTPEYTTYRITELERRLNKIDALQLEVIAERVKEMREEVHGLRRAFYTFAFSVVGSAVIFALTFSFIGH